MLNPNLMHATLSNGVARPPTAGGVMHAGKGESFFFNLPQASNPQSPPYYHTFTLSLQLYGAHQAVSPTPSAKCMTKEPSDR